MLNDDAKPTRKNIYLSRRNNVISEKMKENKLYPNGIYGDESVSENEINSICKDIVNDIINKAIQNVEALTNPPKSI